MNLDDSNEENQRINKFSKMIKIKLDNGNKKTIDNTIDIR